MTNKEGHYKLWNELARTGSSNKHITFRLLFPELVGRSGFSASCFACVEDDDRGAFDDAGCECCPITDDDRTCGNGLYSMWCLAETIKERKRLAALIRDLPWKERENA